MSEKVYVRICVCSSAYERMCVRVRVRAHVCVCKGLYVYVYVYIGYRQRNANSEASGSVLQQKRDSGLLWREASGFDQRGMGISCVY